MTSNPKIKKPRLCTFDLIWPARTRFDSLATKLRSIANKSIS